MSVYKVIVSVPVVINVEAKSLDYAKQIAMVKSRDLYDRVKSPDYITRVLQVERMADQ